jgi:type II secretory pathway component GspD/PulD (secretin)
MNRRTLLLVLLPVAALAQTVPDGQSEQIFRFVHAEAQLGRQEINLMMRSIAQLTDATLDLSAGTLTVRGTADQVNLAQWLFSELDQAPGAPARGMRQYEVPGNNVPQVRIFFLAHATSPQAIQETINALRSIGEIPRISAYTANSAIVLRGSYDQAELAAWMVPLLDQPAGVQPAAAPLEHTYPDPRNATAVRVFRLAHATTPLAMQEIVNAVRSIAEVQRIVGNTPVFTLTLRGTPDEVALAAWIVQELDQQAGTRAATAMDEYPGPSIRGEIVKVSSLAKIRTPEAMQQLVIATRSTAGMQRIVFITAPRALMLRGTAAQMEAAERLIQDADK